MHEEWRISVPVLISKNNGDVQSSSNYTCRDKAGEPHTEDLAKSSGRWVKECGCNLVLAAV